MSAKYKLGLHRGVYTCNWTEAGKRYRRSLGTSNKSEAKRRLAHLSLTETVLDKSRAKTVSQIVDLYLSDRMFYGKDVRRQQTSWKVLQHTFGHLYPQYITKELVFDYKLSRKISDGSIYWELNFLRTALNWGFKHGYLPTKIHIPVPSQPPPKTHYLTKQEFKEALAATKHSHVTLYLTLAISTGARSNAILSLRWSRIDWVRRTINLSSPSQTDFPGSSGRHSPNTGELRQKRRATVPITETLFKALREAYPLRSTEYVIEYSGKPVRNIRYAFRRLSQRLGKRVTSHMLRHSAAVWMAEGGVPMSEISQYLGHSNTGITERVYARYSPDYLRKAASFLEL